MRLFPFGFARATYFIFAQANLPPMRDFAMSEKPVDLLTESEAAAELERLAKEIAAHDRRYYAEDAPTVSDADYDALRIRNASIEARFPELVREDSPSLKVGTAPSGVFGKVVQLDTALQPGDRVEVYRAIICDPTQVPRRDSDDED